jgi:hypothetical protein
MPTTTLHYRLRIRTVSTESDPNGTGDELSVSSLPTDGAPYIGSAPDGDGQEVDPLTGSVRTGTYTVEVVDAQTGTDGTGTIRHVTQKLEDAGARQQLLSRRAYVEISTDGGVTWPTLTAGYVTSIRLVSPMRYAVQIGDTRRVEQTQTIFQGGSLGNYTTRGTITGGPLTSSWGPVQARGGWKYKVLAVSGGNVVLDFQSGYGVGQNAPVVTDRAKVTRPQISEFMASYLQPNPFAVVGGASFYENAFTGTSPDAVSGSWKVSSGIVAWIGASPTTAAPVNALVCTAIFYQNDLSLGVYRVYLYWPTCPYSIGDTVYCSLSTFEVTAQTPLYIDAHPVDLTLAIWDNARIAYDAAAPWIAAMRALVGDSVRIACRFTEAPVIAEFLESAIFGPFGISARTNSSGDQELFPTRIRTSTAPTLTLNAAGMRSPDDVVFELDERTAVSAITLVQQYIQPSLASSSERTDADNNSASAPLDGVMVSSVSQTAQYLDPNLTVFSGRSVEYRVPGMIHTATTWEPALGSQLDAIAVPAFDRYGRGAVGADVQVLAGSSAAAAAIGDEIYFEAPQFPNKGYRIGESSVGARIMQVVRRTESPAGPVLRLLDSGLAAQPATLPTISVAKVTGAPTTTAEYTITNAATLNAGGLISVRVQYASGTSTPTGAGADHAVYAPGQIPTTAQTLPGLTVAGQTVYVRARSEQAARRPSNWTAWSSVTLDAVGAVTGLAASTIRTTAATLSWTNTSTAYPITVYAYQGASAPADWGPYQVATVPAGSTSAVVRTLTGPSVAWRLGVAYIAPGAVGAVASVAVTTNSTVDPSSRPAALAVIPGVDDVTLTQGITLALWASEQTLDLIIERSTSAGSGYAEIARVSGSTPTYADELPRNGTTYYYRIAHALGGFALSSYSQVVSAIARGIPRDVVRPGAVAPVVVVTTAEAGGFGNVILTVSDPQGRVVEVSFRQRTNGGAWSAWYIEAVNPYIYGALIPAAGFVEIEYKVDGYAADGSRGILAAGVETFDQNAVSDMVSVVGTFTSAGAMTLAISADTDTASIRYAVSTSAQPTLATTQAATAIDARNYTVTLAGPYVAGTTVYVSVLGYTAIGGGGAESVLFQYRFVRDGGLVYTECLARMATSSATQIVVTVTGTAPSGSPTVQLVTAPTGSATLASGAAPGVPVASGSSWTFNRGAALGQPGGAQFRAVLASAQSDDDFIEIPEQGRDTTYLASRARVTATTDTTVSVRYAVADPYPQGTNSVTVAYQSLGLPSVSPASGGTLTPAATLTEAVGTYIDYTIGRPAFGAGTGRATYTATASGRVSDSDAVDVPAQERDTINLLSRARIFSQTSTQMVIRYAVATPVALSPNTATITYVTEGLAGIPQTSPQTVTPETNTVITEPAGSYVDFTVPRPAATATPGRITFQSTATGRTASTDAVDVPAQDIIGPSLQIVTTPSSTTYSLVVTWSGTIAYALDGVTQSVAGWTSPRTVTITRSEFLGSTQVAAFAVTRDSSTVSESIGIPPRDNAGASITIGTQSADDTTEIYTFSWSSSGMPTGTTFDLTYTTTTTAGVIEQGTINGATSPENVTSGYNIGSTPRYQMTITAIKSGTLVLSKSRSGTFLT